VSKEEITDAIVSIFEETDPDLPLQFSFIKTEVERKMQLRESGFKLHPQTLQRILGKMMCDGTLAKYPKGYVLAPVRNKDDIDVISHYIQVSNDSILSLIANNQSQSVLMPCCDYIINMLEREKTLKHRFLLERDQRISKLTNSIEVGISKVYEMLSKVNSNLSDQLRQMVDHSLRREYLSPPYSCTLYYGNYCS
jgi:hypothetical protein